jgi:hypothetical protein
VVITSEGMAAIGVEDEAPAPASEADGAQKRAKPKAAKGKAKAAKTAPATRKTKAKAASADKPTPRAGTKQALMIELLKRPEGATVEQIAAATGVEWRRSALPPCGDRFLRPPLRTGRASFPASGSPCSAYG